MNQNIDALTRPFVSVVMPAYNSEKYIEQAINSVLNQSFQSFELIIIDDCSKDRTHEIIEQASKRDSRIKVYKNEVNSGVSYTRNFGVSVSAGDWIAFLDSDDIWTVDKLSKQIALKEKYPDAVITYTGSSFIDHYGKPYSYVLPALPVMTYKELLKRNLLSCSSVMVNKEVMQLVGMRGDRMHEDYSAWLLILREYKYAYGIDEPLLIYRLSQNSKSSNRLKSAKMIFNSYHYVGYNALISALLTLRYSLHSIRKRRLIKFGVKQL